MSSATEVEVYFALMAAAGLVCAAVVAWWAVRRLAARLRSGRNGAVRALAWERAVVAVAVFVGLLALAALAAIVVVAPARDQAPEPGLQAAAVELSARYAAALLLTATTLYTVIAVALFEGQRRLDRYFRNRPIYTEANHPGRRAGDRMELDDAIRKDNPWRPDEPPPT